MADFDPAQYLAEKTAAAAPAGGGFDPAKYLAEKTAPVPAKPEGIDIGGIANSVMRGAAQGGSLGFADEATAGIGGLKDYIAGKLGLRGEISLPDAYRGWENAIQRADAKAAQDHPAAYIGGQVGGGLATAFAPGLGMLNAGKGAGAGEAILKGAALGAAGGAGNAKTLVDVPSEMLTGAEVGGVLGGGLNALGRVGSAVASKLRPAAVGSVLLNAPESALQRYIDNPAAVNAARSRADIVADSFLPRIEALQNDVTGGSQASRAILDAEGNTVKGSTIADLLDAKRAQILSRAEGVMDDPRMVAAARWLQDTADKYRPEVIPGATEATGLVDAAGNAVTREVPAQTIDKELSTSRVKDLLQSLDHQTEYEVAPGRFSQVANNVRSDIRGQVDQLLKGQSQAYTDQMKKVAADTQLLGQVSDLARSPQGFDNLLKRTQRGTTPQLMGALQKFDERTGGGLLGELQDSAVKDALNRGATNGSRNVLFQGGLGDTIGEAVGGLPGRLIGRTIGFLGGATADKYGPAMARGLVDNAAKIQGMLSSSEGFQTLGKYAVPLMQAAQQGNRTLAATDAYLLATDPNYRKIFNKDAVTRRIERTGE